MKKMNNKGFSLVELIIVIAIMAILIVVLAPQYLRYVERSRNSTDMQNATEIVTAFQTYQADPESQDPLTATDNVATVTINPNGTANGETGNTDFVDDALNQTGLDLADINCMSRTRWTNYTISVTLNAAGGLDVVYTSTPGGTPDPFAQAMTGN